MHNKIGSLPVRSDPSARPISRHNSTSYIDRVKESLTTRVSKFICAIFLTVLLCLSIVFFILWINLRPHRPRFHISEFSLPGLGNTDGFETSHISFKITAHNPNKKDPKNMSLIEGVLRGPTMTVNKDRWKQMGRDRNQGKVVFRLDVVSVIRFKVYTWHSKRHRMHANCYVEVGWDGMLLSQTKDKRCPVYFT
ncbi:uncharacterized protein LOC106352234 isoform X2 [Brassica napus]|uniref:uncharacterized protein LOC106352234 isoform X2 n=1 Tax=Brassica napus TaxID=3708 RepID=UPI0006AAD715|nr:uncharacterized protein LOC106352234 isoform X2 [Brassica napus]